MLNEVKKAMAKKIFEVTGYMVNLELTIQGFEKPCFFIEYIQSSTKTAVYIDYMKDISLDIIFLPKDNLKANNDLAEIVNKLDGITNIKVNNINCKIESIDIYTAEDSLHYQVVIHYPLNAMDIIYPSNKTYKLLIDELTNISNKKVYYLNGDLQELQNDFFVIEPSNVIVTNQGLYNGKKEYERDIAIRYVTTKNNIDVISYLENVMDKLMDKLKINNIYKIKYELDVNYEQEEYQDISIISHELIISFIERSN